jgi:hypothetical protein
VSDLPNRVGFTITFLRMAATQMRALAGAPPRSPESLARLPISFTRRPTVLPDILVGNVCSGGAALSW